MEATVDPTLACDVVTCFGRQWELQEFTDLTVHIDGKDFKCHRIILESCSKFFNGSQDECSLKDIEPEIFELILEVLYKGNDILNVDNAINIWAAACKLEIGFLVQVCEDFVMGMITVDNYMSIYRMATFLNSGKVLHAVRQKIVQEFHLVMLSNTFFELTLDDILAVIGCQDIRICANGLIQAIFTWVKAEAFDGLDREMRADGAKCPANTMDMNRLGTEKSRSIASDRSNYLGILLEAVNLENISDDCLTQLMSDDMVLTCYTAVQAVNMIAVQRLNTKGEPYLDTCTSSGACLLHQTNQQLLESLGPSLQTSEGTTEVTSTVDPVLACGVMNCLEKFQDLQTFSDISDFTVQVGEKSFKCHKFIIGSCSEFFSGLLRSDMKEKAENSAEIKGIRSCIFELILEVLYRGRNILSKDNMIEIWHAANQLQIVFLLKACEEFIIKNIRVENCVDVFKNATLLMTGDVLKETRQFIVRNFYQIIISVSFRYLSVDDLLDIFGSNNKCIMCSNGLVECILKWLNVKTSATRDMEVENKAARSGNSLSSNNIQKMTPVVSDKHEDLEKLMKAIELDSVTDDCLKNLMCNEMVLATPNVIRAVNAIAVQRWSSGTVLRPEPCFKNCSNLFYCSIHKDRDH